MSSTSNRLRKQDCIDLRARLVDLGYGQAEAETPELFAQRLYPVAEHLRALDPNVVLVVGPRVRPPVEQAADLVDYLIDLGVFRRRSDDRIDVPNLYLFGLNLRRKGGVRRGPRSHAGARL